MRSFLYILLFFSSSLCFAQNYQCLQPGVQHYFINSDHYLRGVRVDSVSLSGDTTVYHLYRTERGSCFGTMYLGPCDTNGGSWLGHRVLQQADGTFIFDNRWGNNVIIKPQAAVGDSWVMYADGSSLRYDAQVTGIDTITVLGVLDSVKRLRITANDTAGVVTTDSLTGVELLLSKNHGFVQVCDLYTFPYHRADSAYRAGLDFYLDVCTKNMYGTSVYRPGTSNAIFKIVSLTPPNDVALHNWSIGDVFERSYSAGLWPNFYSGGNILDSIVSKNVTGHKTVYGTSGWRRESGMQIIRSGSVVYYDTVFSIVDSIKMPEELYLNKPIVYFYPKDTFNCITADEFKLYGDGRHTEVYKCPIGIISYWDMDDMGYFSDTSLIAYKMGSRICGNLPPGLSVAQISAGLPRIILHPNPVTDNILIDADLPMNKVEMVDMTSRVLLYTECNTTSLQLDVSRFPPGLYLVRVNNSVVQRFVKQ